MGERREVAAQIAPLLARYQRRLIALRAELTSSPSLTTWTDEALDLDTVLDPVSRAIEAVAATMHARSDHRSRRSALAGELSILWADLLEIDSVRLRRRWGYDDVPVTWTDCHRLLLDTLEKALDDLRR